MLYKEVNGVGNIEEISELIVNGHTDNSILYVIREAVPKSICKQIKNNFIRLSTEETDSRPDDGYVKTKQIGSSQFDKNGKEYIDATISCANSVMDVFSGLNEDTIRNLFLDQDLESHFSLKSINYRPALHLTSSANFATTRCWLDNGEMSLMPHDDTAQLSFAAKDGFEIAEGSCVIATNLCIDDSSEGAELVVWNVLPDDELREKFDVVSTGYPYPIDYVDQFEKISIKLSPGDLYFLNASYVHGVTNSNDSSRITSGRFITNIKNKVVYWT